MAANTAGVSPSQTSIEATLKVDLYGTAVLLKETGKIIAPLPKHWNGHVFHLHHLPGTYADRKPRAMPVAFCLYKSTPTWQGPCKRIQPAGRFISPGGAANMKPFGGQFSPPVIRVVPAICEILNCIKKASLNWGAIRNQMLGTFLQYQAPHPSAHKLEIEIKR